MTEATTEPISGRVEALPHTPIYRMHRYFARRPYNVINALIEHYSKPGDIILDPFCGGGTTVVESLRLRRKVIGVDINPMATFITRCEVMNLDPEDVKTTLEWLAQITKEEINALYQTLCPECGAQAITNWTKWSVVYICPHCDGSTVVAETEKVGPGKYVCTACEQVFRVTGLRRAADKMLELHISCSACGFEGIKQATDQDTRRYVEQEQRVESVFEQGEIWYPQQAMPLDYELRKPNNMICERFSDFFSRRNLLALAKLLRRIRAIEDREMRYFLEHVFTSIVGWTNRMVTDERHGWALHAYWLPDIYCENNVWILLKRRGEWAVRGKQCTRKEIGDYFAEAQSVADVLDGDATCLLLTRSSTGLPLLDRSVDAVITDPPYGGNVQYSELSNFWAVWLPETLEFGNLIHSAEEVVMKRYKEGEAEKFEQLLSQVFSECHRVLKDSGGLVVTFNNRDTSVWFSMLRAARRAGFYLTRGGITYQAPIADYTRTLHQMKDGAIKGDFILSFRKGSSSIRSEDQLRSEDIEAFLVELVTDVLREGPATFSQIYQEVIPALVTHSTLDSIVEALDLEQVLFDNFELKEIPIEAETDWPIKKTTVRKWALRETPHQGEPA
jgi:putative DNA methylase